MSLTRPKLLASAAMTLALAACVSGGVVYVPVPVPADTDASAPVSQPADDYVEPLELTLGQPVHDRFVVQTNRPAYVAIFEVIPEEGVTIVRPSTTRESFVVAGLNTVRVPWSTTSVSRTSAGDVAHYLYAVASDEPLRFDDQSFQPGYLRYTLGTRVYRSSDPYEVMRALSRHFVSARVADEEWAEDVAVVRPEVTTPTRVSHVFCPNGTRYDVPAEMAARVRCARTDHTDHTDHTDRTAQNAPHPSRGTYGRRPGDGSAAPDSVIGDDHRRVRPLPPTRVGGVTIDRVNPPTVANNDGRPGNPKGGVPTSEDGGRGRGNGNNGSAGSNGNGQGNAGNGQGNGQGNGGANGNGNANGQDGRGNNGDHGNNGNAYGRDGNAPGNGSRGNGNEGAAGRTNGSVGNGNGSNGNASNGNGRGNGSAGNGNAGNERGNGNGHGNGNDRGYGNASNGNASNGNASGNSSNDRGRNVSDTPSPIVLAASRDSLRALPDPVETRPARPAKAPGRVPVAEPAPEPKAEPRDEPVREPREPREPREEAKAEPRDDAKPAQGDESKAQDKPESKPESKPDSSADEKPEATKDEKEAKPAKSRTSSDSLSSRMKSIMKGRAKP